MIVKTFDQGWGQIWPWKQFEIRTVDTMLQNLQTDLSATVVINSVWYSQEAHQQTMSWLRSNNWDQIVLVAMLDAAIPKIEWFEEFDRPVFGLGYYPGINALDLCAIFVAENLDLAAYGDLSDCSGIDTAFMCLNRKPHWHRRQLYERLDDMGLLSRGLISMGSNDGKAQRTLLVDCDADIVSPNSDVSHYGIPNNVCSLGHLDNWRRHFLNVVTETFFDINTNFFVSEKIYKPIVGEKPFLVYDPDGGSQWLQTRGFETYTEDFKDISDLDLRVPENLAPFLRALCDQGVLYWRAKYLALRPKILHNKHRFRDYVQEQRLIVQRGIQCLI